MSTQPKERPILFSTPMVNAILEGRKTQTRRIIKRLPERPVESIEKCYGNRFLGQIKHGVVKSGVWGIDCPYGEIGDILWVRETWAEICGNEDGVCNGHECLDHYYEYRADNPGAKYAGEWPNEFESNEVPASCKWRPSLFMPRAACRIRLKITDIRVERLQGISETDAANEGVLSVFGLYRDYINNNNTACDTARDSFRTLWQSINGHDSWNQNPWVWVVSFERI